MAIGANLNLNLWKESYDLEQAKDYKRAAQVLFPVLRQSPNHELLWLRLGWLSYLSENYNDSIKYYTRALNINPYSIDARLGLTLPLLAQSRWKEAAIYARQVIAISAWNYYAHIRLMASEAGQLEWEVLQDHAAAVALHYPSDPTVFAYLALAYAMQSERAKAILTYNQVLERSPDNKEALNYLSKINYACESC